MKKYLLILTAILLSVVTGCKKTENDKKLSIELSLDKESVTATGAVINVKQENATKCAYLLTNDTQAKITIEDVFAKGTEFKSSDTKINLNGLKANTDYKVVAAISGEGQQLLSNEVKFKTQELPANAPVIKFKQKDVTDNSAVIEVTTEKATKAIILCEPKGMTANADEEYIRENGEEIPSEMLNKSFESTFEALSAENTYVIYSVVENESVVIVGETFEFTTLEEIDDEQPFIKFELVDRTSSTVEYTVTTKNVTSVKLLTQLAEEPKPSEAIINAMGVDIPSDYLNATYTVSLDELPAETEYAVYALVKGENDTIIPEEPFRYTTLADSTLRLATATATVSSDSTNTIFRVLFWNKNEDKKVILSFRGENGTTYLAKGTYSLSAGTLDGDNCYYTKILNGGDSTYTFSEATAEVSVNPETGVYNITINGTLNDDNTLNAIYEGKIDGMYFGGSNEYEYESPSVETQIYSVNNGAGTNIFLNLLKSEDQAYPYARVSFYLEGTVRYLPVGTYNIAGKDYGSVNAVESKYWLNQDVAIGFKEGTVGVQLQGNVYTITVNATLNSGESLQVTYTGEISDFTIPDPAETIQVTFVTPEMVHKQLTDDVREYIIKFTDENKAHTVEFDFKWKEGDYVPAAESWSTDNALDYYLVKSSCKYYNANNTNGQFFKTIELKTEIKNGKYEVNFNVTTISDLTIVGTYVGDFPEITLPGEGGGEEPVEEPIEYVNAAAYIQGPEEIIVIFTDANDQNSLLLDFKYYSGESYLPAGVYSFGNNGLTHNSTLDDKNLQDAVINVDIVDGEYVIDMSFTTNAGVKKRGTFKGQLDGIKLPEEEDNTVVFNNADCKPLALDNYTEFRLTFNNDNDNTLCIYLYGAASDEVIDPGTYEAVPNANEAGKVNASNSCYFAVASSNECSYFASGEVTVALNEETHVYTINVTAVLDNGNTLKAVYEGEISGLYFYPEDEPVCYQFAAQEAIGSYQDSYNDRTPVILNLYEKPYNENESSANFPYVHLELNTEAGATHLLPGTYTLTNNDGTVGEGSLQNSRFYNRDQHEVRFTEGTLEVAIDENREYSITLTGTLTNGRTVDITYSGAIDGFIVPEPETRIEVAFVNPTVVNKDLNSNPREYDIKFTDASNDHSVEFDFKWTEGDYVPAASWSTENTLGYYLDDTNCKYFDANNNEQSFKEIEQLTTVINNDGQYEVNFTATTESNLTIVGTYVGEFPEITLPGEEVEFTNAVCDPWALDNYTKFKLTFNNDNNNTLYIELHGAASDEVIAPGTYEAVPNANEAGKVNASNSCYFAVASSYEASYFTSGEVTVALNKETHVYTINVTAELENGNTLKAVYEGEIDGLYFYPADEPNHYQFAAQAGKGYYDNSVPERTPITLNLYENSYDEWGDNYPYVHLELNTEAGATYLLPGTYNLSNNDGTVGAGSLQSSRFYNRDQHGVSFAAGTVVVAIDENREYSITLNGTLTNERTVEITYNGAVDGFIVPQPETTIEVTFVKAKKRYRNGNDKDIEIGFLDAKEEHEVAFDFKWTDGDYVPAASWSRDNTLDHYLVNAFCKYYSAGDYQGQSFKTIELTTEINNGQYEVRFTVTTESNLTIVGTYVGDFPTITLPAEGGEEDEGVIKYVTTESQYFQIGDYWVKFIDANGQNAVYLEFIWYSGVSYLPTGEYSIGNGLSSWGCTFRDESSSSKLQNAVAKVDIVDGKYVIEMSFTTPDGVQMKGKYEGQLDGIKLP